MVAYRGMRDYQSRKGAFQTRKTCPCVMTERDKYLIEQGIDCMVKQLTKLIEQMRVNKLSTTSVKENLDAFQAIQGEWSRTPICGQGGTQKMD